MRDVCEVMQSCGITDALSEEAISLCLNCPEPKCLLGIDHKQYMSQGRVDKAMKLSNSGLGTAEIARTMHKSKRQVLRYLEVTNA